MILTILISFFIGFILPFVASRFGKILPADPGTILVRLWHKPHFPKKTTLAYRKKLYHKWLKLIFYSVCWGIISALLNIGVLILLPADTTIWASVFIYLVILGIIIDQQFCLLPDFVTFPLLLTGFWAAYQGHFLSIEDSLIGAVFGYVVSIIAVIVMTCFHQAVFGAGDVKMLAALGAWLGAYGLNLALLISFVLFSGWSFIKCRGTGPFGPALGIAAVFSLFYLYYQ